MTVYLSAEQLASFVEEVECIKREAYAAQGSADLRHLRRTEMYGRLAAVLAYLTAWIPFNPIAIFGFSLAQFTRWLMAHHILHRGYDRIAGVPKRYTSKYFARGSRRYLDWLDWLHPDAWDYEHNVLHHYYTGEEIDPDLVERNSEFMRRLPLPRWLRYVLAVGFGLTWKYTYYAPSTISTLKLGGVQRKPKEQIKHLVFSECFNFSDPLVRRLWKECYLPYATLHFILIPLLYLPLGKLAVLAVLLNKFLAECLTNLHTYIVILPNHSADDVFRYDFHYNDKAQFYITQIVGSVNYQCGDELTDYLCIYLNYQIEHHLIPDLSMLGYRRVQPKVKDLCLRYGIPYNQEGVLKRFKKMLDICVGASVMPKAASFADVVSPLEEIG